MALRRELDFRQVLETLPQTLQWVARGLVLLHELVFHTGP
jgi:hypothetical protein